MTVSSGNKQYFCRMSFNFNIRFSDFAEILTPKDAEYAEVLNKREAAFTEGGNLNDVIYF